MTEESADTNKKGGFLGASDRPYKGDFPGQLENREGSEGDGPGDGGEGKYSSHGNVGFAGNYNIGPVTEK